MCGRVPFEPEFLGGLAAIGRGLDGDEVHLTLGAFAGLVGDDLRVHEAGVENGRLGVEDLPVGQ
jgi:hypothetical protein